MKLALFVAFPQELRQIVRRFGIKERYRKGAFGVVVSRHRSVDIIMIESGMGERNAEESFSYVISQYHPDLILSVGFGGALYPGAAAGDLVWASRIFLVPRSADKEGVPPSDSWQQLLAWEGAAGIFIRLSRRLPVREGSILTLSNWGKKSKLIGSVPRALPLPVSDMETFFVARFSSEAKLPFLAVRAITDNAAEEIPRELLEVTDEDGMYKLSRALGVVISRPKLFPAIVRLGRNSHVASRNLSRLIEALAVMLEEEGDLRIPLADRRIG